MKLQLKLTPKSYIFNLLGNSFVHHSTIKTPDDLYHTKIDRKPFDVSKQGKAVIVQIRKNRYINSFREQLTKAYSTFGTIVSVLLVGSCFILYSTISEISHLHQVYAHHQEVKKANQKVFDDFDPKISQAESELKKGNLSWLNVNTSVVLNQREYPLLHPNATKEEYYKDMISLVTEKAQLYVNKKDKGQAFTDDDKRAIAYLNDTHNFFVNSFNNAQANKLLDTPAFGQNKQQDLPDITPLSPTSSQYEIFQAKINSFNGNQVVMPSHTFNINDNGQNSTIKTPSISLVQ